MDCSKTKQLVRRAQRRLRKALGSEDRQRKSREITDRLLVSRPFEEAELIHVYLSIGDEVGTKGLIEAAFQLKKRIAVPVVDVGSRVLAFSELSSPEAGILETGPFGVPRPKPRFQKWTDADEIDLWVVPGLAFDAHGNRLGYGGGYYDRALRDCQKPVIGLAFEKQIVPQLPAEATDVPVDMIMTEARTIVCRGDGCDGSTY